MVLRYALIASAFALVAAACQTEPQAPTFDARPTFDAAVGVQCAQTLCSTQFGCCTVGGSAPSCLTSTGEACAGKVIMCDVPEDCTGGTSCCVLSAGGTACEGAGQCEGQGAIACNADADCPADLPACCNGECGSQCDFW
jgi:hypothetical protein